MIFLGNPSVKNGDMSTIGRWFFFMFVIGCYLLCWVAFNACTGNVEPTWWDFTWQTLAFLGFVCLFV